MPHYAPGLRKKSVSFPKNRIRRTQSAPLPKKKTSHQPIQPKLSSTSPTQIPKNTRKQAWQPITGPSKKITHDKFSPVNDGDGYQTYGLDRDKVISVFANCKHLRPSRTHPTCQHNKYRRCIEENMTAALKDYEENLKKLAEPHHPENNDFPRLETRPNSPDSKRKPYNDGYNDESYSSSQFDEYNNSFSVEIPEENKRLNAGKRKRTKRRRYK
jgi:hypothetical protein